MSITGNSLFISFIISLVLLDTANVLSVLIINDPDYPMFTHLVDEYKHLVGMLHIFNVI